MGLTHGNVIFDILEPSAFQKYSIFWSFERFSVKFFLHVFCSLVFSAHNSSDLNEIILQDFRSEANVDVGNEVHVLLCN